MSIARCNRYAIAGLAEYRPLVLQLGDEDVSQAAVTSITKYAAKNNNDNYHNNSNFTLPFSHKLVIICLVVSCSFNMCNNLNRFSARADLVQWTALAIANLASELKLSVALGAANCCDVLVHVSSAFNEYLFHSGYRFFFP